jgi:hypothetical protein
MQRSVAASSARSSYIFKTSSSSDVHVESDGIDDKFDYVKIRNGTENLPECATQRDRPLSRPAKASA